MNCEEISKKTPIELMRYLRKRFDEDGFGYQHVDFQLLADWHMSEVALAEKRARLSLLEYLIDMDNSHDGDLGLLCRQLRQQIITANSEHAPITSTTNNELLATTEQLNCEVNKIILNIEPVREGE